MKILSSNLPDNYKTELNDIFFRNYLLKKSDILKCSNPSCDYAGMTSASHFGCRVPFHCESCGQDWIHPIIGGTSDNKWQRFRTYITKTLSTKRCPHCQTDIMKNGGCDTVTCTSCGKKFTWGSVFKPEIFVIFMLIFIPVFIVICCFYQKMLDRAETDKGMKAGLWIIHIFLLYTCTYLMIRYIKVTKRIIEKKIKSVVLCWVVFLLVLATPVAGLAGLNWLLPDYYLYWLQIGAYTALGLGATFVTYSTYLVCKTICEAIRKPKPRGRVPIRRSALNNNAKPQTQQERNEIVVNNEKDLENQKFIQPTQQELSSNRT